MSKAIFVLEHPWWGFDEQKNDATVLPFFYGLERLYDPLKIYHMHFFEANSFERSLERISSAPQQRKWLYIAAHGSEGGLASMRKKTLVDKVRNGSNIEGIIIGSCHLGADIEMMKDLFPETSLRWVIGYKNSIDWMTGMLIDLRIFETMSMLRSDALRNENRMIANIQSAISLFNGEYKDGAEDKNGNQVSLASTLSLVIRREGSRGRAKDATESLISALGS